MDRPNHSKSAEGWLRGEREVHAIETLATGRGPRPWPFWIMAGVVASIFACLLMERWGLVERNGPPAALVAYVGASIGFVGSLVWILRHDLYDALKNDCR